jgi:hypothetical protein
MDIPPEKINKAEKTIIHSILPVLWWIAIWEITEIVIHWCVKHHIQGRLIFYIGMLTIISGILYFDPTVITHL